MQKLILKLKFYLKFVAYLSWRTYNKLVTTLLPKSDWFMSKFLVMFIHSPRHAQPQFEMEMEKAATRKEKIQLKPSSAEPSSENDINIYSSVDRWNVTVPQLETQYAPGSRIPLSRHIVAWEFGSRNDPTVLLVHGFAGRGLQLSEIAVNLVKRRFHVLVCDYPGCGQSPGSKTAPLVFVGAIARIAQQPLPGADSPPKIVAIVAHSMGVLATTGVAILYRRALFNLQQKDMFPELKSLVLIAGTESVDHVLRIFAKAVGVADVAYPHLLSLMSRPPRLHWDTLNNGALLEEMSDARWQLSIPKVFLIHDDADKEVHVSQGRLLSKRMDAVSLTSVDEIADAVKESSTKTVPCVYLETHGLGHKRILRDAEICRGIATFIESNGI
jgi:pimeloyl-ACP methyl ester carboxylesterase